VDILGNLTTVIAQLLQLADVRNLDWENPIFVKLFCPASRRHVGIVIGSLEPSLNDYPLNVLWLVTNSVSIHYHTILKRTSDKPAAGMRNTWKSIATTAEICSSAQYFASLRSAFSPFDVLVLTAEHATTTILGIFKLTVDALAGVGTNDPRNNDARLPTPHTHDFVGRLIAWSGGELVIDPLQRPTPSQVFMVGAESSVAFSTVVRANVIDYTSKLLSAVIVGPSALGESTTALYAVSGTFADGVVRDVPFANVVLSSSLPLAADFTGAMLVAASVDNDTPVVLTAVVTQPSKNVSLTISKTVMIMDQAKPTTATMIGNSSIGDQSSSAYSLRVVFNDATTRNVTIGSVSETVLWSLGTTTSCVIGQDGVLTAYDIVGNDSVTIYASYTTNNTTVNASKTVAIVDRDDPIPMFLTIVGPASVDGGFTADYSVIIQMSDGATLVRPAVWSVTPTTTSYVCTLADVSATNLARLTTTPLFTQELLALTASFTGARSTTVVGNKNVTVVPKNTFSSVSVTGPTQISEMTPQTWSCTILFTNGLTTPPTSSVWSWSSAATYLTKISDTTDSVTLTTSDVVGDKDFVLQVAAKFGLGTYTASRSVRVLDATVYPTDVRVGGNYSVAANIPNEFVCEVSFDNQATWVPHTVANSATWTFSKPGVTKDSSWTVAADKLTGTLVGVLDRLASSGIVRLKVDVVVYGRTVNSPQVDVTVTDSTNYIMSYILETTVENAIDTAGRYTLLTASGVARVPFTIWAVFKDLTMAKMTDLDVELTPINYALPVYNSNVTTTWSTIGSTEQPVIEMDASGDVTGYFSNLYARANKFAFSLRVVSTNDYLERTFGAAATNLVGSDTFNIHVVDPALLPVARVNMLLIGNLVISENSDSAYVPLAVYSNYNRVDLLVSEPSNLQWPFSYALSDFADAPTSPSSGGVAKIRNIVGYNRNLIIGLRTGGWEFVRAMDVILLPDAIVDVEITGPLTTTAPCWANFVCYATVADGTRYPLHTHEWSVNGTVVKAGRFVDNSSFVFKTDGGFGRLWVRQPCVITLGITYLGITKTLTTTAG